MNKETNISEKELDLLERFISRNMQPGEQAALEAELKGNIVMQEQVEEVKLLMLGISEAVLHEKLADFHSALPAEVKKQSKIASLNRWLIAAALIMVAGVGAWLLIGRQSSEEKMFAAYYKPDPGLISAMSTSDNYTFDRAMVDYKTGSYDSALKAWKSLLIDRPDNDTLNYFVASALLAKGENEQAIEHFKKVVAVPGGYFVKDAYWYIGLALVKQQKIDEAIPFVEKSDHRQKDELLLKLR